MKAKRTSLLMRSMGPAQFGIITTSFLLKVVIFNFSYLVYLVASDFTTDLFVDDIDSAKFFYCVVIVNAVTFLFYRGFTTPELPDIRNHSPTDRGINNAVIVVILAGFTAAYVALGQKTLSLSSSIALLAIAANSRAVAFLALSIFAAGVPQALALDEYIPMIFCALINLFVFLPWLLTRGRRLFVALCLLAFALVGALATYYILYRYNVFKLVERIYEQAAPLSWQGSALLWFQPHSIIDGMPDERLFMAMDGEWDAQFKMTYLVMNSPLVGSAFLLAFALWLGRFAGRTLLECQLNGANVLKNFLKLKLILILIEVLGEKVSDIEKIIGYALLILALEMLDRPRPRLRRASQLGTVGQPQHLYGKTE